MGQILVRVWRSNLWFDSMEEVNFTPLDTVAVMFMICISFPRCHLTRWKDWRISHHPPWKKSNPQSQLRQRWLSVLPLRLPHCCIVITPFLQLVLPLMEAQMMNPLPLAFPQGIVVRDIIDCSWKKTARFVCLLQKLELKGNISFWKLNCLIRKALSPLTPSSYCCQNFHKRLHYLPPLLLPHFLLWMLFAKTIFLHWIFTPLTSHPMPLLNGNEVRRKIPSHSKSRITWRPTICLRSREVLRQRSSLQRSLENEGSCRKKQSESEGIVDNVCEMYSR